MLAKVSAFFIFATTLSYATMGMAMFCFGSMPVGFMSATITLALYALCVSLIMILTAVMAIVVYITFLGWLLVLVCCYRDCSSLPYPKSHA
jgi:hypothetical protein